MEIIENNRKQGCHLMVIGNKLDLKEQRQVQTNSGKIMTEDIQNDIKLRFGEDIHGNKQALL